MRRVRYVYTDPTVSEQLRQAIQAAWISQYELAKRADVSQSVLSKFLADRTKQLHLSTAESIAKAIGYDLKLVRRKE